MRLHKFGKQVGTRMALTKDKTAEKLPFDRTRWIYLGTVDVAPTDGPRIGAASADIISAIETDGFFLWPESDDAQGT